MKTVKFPSELPRQYFNYLKKLVGYPTCFWRDNVIADAIAFCSDVMELLPDHWTNYTDEAGNLIVYNQLADISKPMCFLCSHVDVVGAEASAWQTPPFTAIETCEYIIGRGANDCKAGTALQLTLAWLLAGEDSRHYNLGFVFMFREEGNRGKTSSLLRLDDLPLSAAGTYFITLENTVSLAGENEFELGVYDREPHNLFITCSGLLEELVHPLNSLERLGWKPVQLYPEIAPPEACLRTTLHNKHHGHSATLVAASNPLKSIIEEHFASCGSISTGQKGEASVVSPSVQIYNGDPGRHDLIYNYRGFEPLKRVRQKLSWLNHRETYGFENGLGSNQREAFRSSSIAVRLAQFASNNTAVSVQSNPGRSDASAIWNSCTTKQKEFVVPFAMGPGCRTHTDIQGIRRATHGNDEGFFKPLALPMLEFFFKLITDFKTL